MASRLIAALPAARWDTLDPLRRSAEVEAEGLRRLGTACHVRRWLGGHRGRFVRRDTDYALLVEVEVQEG